MRNRRVWLAVTLVAPLAFTDLHARQDAPCTVTTLVACVPEPLRGLLSLPEGFDPARLLEDPETLNRLLRAATRDPSLANILGDLEVEFRTFHAADSSTTSLGVSYTYDKSVVSTPGPQSGTSFSGFELSLQAEGNVAFDPDVNPRNFLRSQVAMSYVQSRGGVGSGTLSPDSIARAIDRFADIGDEAELDAASAAFVMDLRNQLTTQVFLSFGLAGGFESDQSFDDKQLTGEVTLGLDVKAWNPNTTVARVNLLDWPFAALRYLLGTDPEISPRGSNLPTVILRLGMVDPTASTLREPLGEMGAYPRFSVEAAFKSVLLDTERNTITFESNFRYYRELGASDAVAAANLDDLAYFVAALVSSNGMFVSYSRGRLPLDVNNDLVYAMGFRYRF